MKRIIRIFAFWLLKISKSESSPAITNKHCKIIKDGRFLIATMPNGDIIPCQTNLTINNGLNDRFTCLAKIEMRIPLSNIQI